MVSRLNYSSGAGNKGGFNKGKHWTDVRWLFVSFFFLKTYNFINIYSSIKYLSCIESIKHHRKNFGNRNEKKWCIRITVEKKWFLNTNKKIWFNWSNGRNYLKRMVCFPIFVRRTTWVHMIWVRMSVEQKGFKLTIII